MLLGASKSGADFANLPPPSSCGAQDRLVGWVPAFEVSDVLTIEHGTADLQQVVGAPPRPSHVPVALHPLPDHIVNNRFGSGARARRQLF